jgi:Ni2+-binding GTPase involved in maturation of urease and hydrogenase
MPQTRFVMIGGFLGAGKTTAIARLARTYQDQGRHVAIITNDHAAELVDTHRLRWQGFSVGEIPGGCFCGSLEEFTQAVDRLSEIQQPDVVLVEPIGSCTDLAATVIRPLHEQFGERFEIAPYSVLLKPSHGLKILRGQPRAGFSPQAEYIFRKQLEEADVIAINRIDQLAPAEADEIQSLLGEQYPAANLVRTSAATGQGFDALIEMLEQRGEFGQRRVPIDYARYAAGEAELGWLNCSVLVSGRRPFDLDGLLMDLVGGLRSSLAAAGAETAHLKVIGLAGGSCGVVNLVSRDSPPERSLAAHCSVPQARIIINARVAAEPALVSSHVRGALDCVCSPQGLAITDRHAQSFRPGQPTVRLVSIS